MKRIRDIEDIAEKDVILIKKIKKSTLSSRNEDKSGTIIIVTNYDKSSGKGKLLEKNTGEGHQFDVAFFIDMSESYIIDDELGKVLYEE